jgi:hypothetical protein
MQKTREMNQRRSELEAQQAAIVQHYKVERGRLEAISHAARDALRQAETDWEASPVRRAFVAAQVSAGIAQDSIDASTRAECAELDVIRLERERLDFESRQVPQDPGNWRTPDWHMPSETAAARIPERDTEWLSVVSMPVKP